MKRFAFYGRVSTEDQQDPTSSRNWQLARSRQVIEPDGEIVAEFFDIGHSRSLPWKRRPEASRLLDSFRRPDRGFDAVVIGEPQRAFYGNQFGLTFPVFVHYGVELWVPEVGGAVDPGSEAHDLVMTLYGGMSKGERMRIRTRVRTAMAAQAAVEGRFLGGRPPYGYVLADAGPHPNPAKAAIGQRLRRLVPDPIAAPVVQRIFADYCGGVGLHTIAQSLNDDGIPSPSGHDPERNPHRATGRGLWAKSAVRAILVNPRYTGFEVWNKQRKDEVLIDVDDVALGHQTKMRWNNAAEWVWSPEPRHEPLVTRDEFEAAQAQFDRSKRAMRRTPAAGRQYVLAGILHCGACGRRMQGQWNHDRAYYRCRFRADYAVGDDTHPKSVYVRENALIPGLDACLATLFDDDHIDDTCAALAGTPEANDEAVAREAQLRAGLAECDRKLAKYRALLDHEDAVEVAAKWIAETQRERKALERQLGQRVPGGKLTTEQVKALASSLRDIVEVLAEADLDDKARLYNELGISLTLDRAAGIVHVQAQPRGAQVRVGGGTLTPVFRVATRSNPKNPTLRGFQEATGRRQTVMSAPLVARESTLPSHPVVPRRSPSRRSELVVHRRRRGRGCPNQGQRTPPRLVGNSCPDTAPQRGSRSTPHVCGVRRSGPRLEVRVEWATGCSQSPAGEAAPHIGCLGSRRTRGSGRG